MKRESKKIGVLFSWFFIVETNPNKQVTVLVFFNGWYDRFISYEKPKLLTEYYCYQESVCHMECYWEFFAKWQRNACNSLQYNLSDNQVEF